MPAVDLQQLATDRRALVGGQYASRELLEARVSIYDYLQQPHWPASASGSFEAWVADHVAWSGHETVVDVGCGPGTYFETLRQRAGQVIGVDLSLGMLVSVLPERTRGVAMLAADAQSLPVASGSVDVVLCAHMLYHVPDIASALREVHRVLRPGGQFLATANGAADKVEIGQVWEEAAAEVLGRSFRPPSWGERFNLDIAADVVSPVLTVLGVDRSEGQFVLPNAEPALVWINSLRAGTETELGDDDWNAVNDLTRRRINSSLSDSGRFIATKCSGVVIACKQA